MAGDDNQKMEREFREAMETVLDEHEPEYSQLLRVLGETRDRLHEIQKVAFQAGLAAVTGSIERLVREA